MTDVCGDNRFEIIKKAKQDLLESTNISSSEDEMKVLDSFLFRCWQMGWLDKYDAKESGCEADCTTIDEDLEAEIQRYFSEKKWIYNPLAEIARHFANWQHGKDFDDLLQSEMKFPKEYYERGKADMREEMMKDAADSKITTDGNSIFPIIKYQLPLTYDCKIGDKVKIIIIKEEQQ